MLNNVVGLFGVGGLPAATTVDYLVVAGGAGGGCVAGGGGGAGGYRTANTFSLPS